ncbi:RloB family protein [Pseudodesulfovibrio sp.]|nr:RloB family protein [Pseudodesulfovibrio sp.]
MARHNKRSHSPRRRSAGFKAVREKILIVCEGAKTEPNYFESFKLTNIDVRVFGEGANTVSLVERAEHRASMAKQHGQPFDSVWVVFDRDSFPPRNVEEACIKVEQLGFKLAFSNEAFELWYILHFGYRDTGMPRNEYQEALSNRLRVKYKKNDATMFDRLRPYLDDGIRNAKKLAATYSGNIPYHSRNPYTSVYELVEILKKYLKD